MKSMFGIAIWACPQFATAADEHTVPCVHSFCPCIRRLPSRRTTKLCAALAAKIWTLSVSRTPTLILCPHRTFPLVLHVANSRVETLQYVNLCEQLLGKSFTSVQMSGLVCRIPFHHVES